MAEQAGIWMRRIALRHYGRPAVRGFGTLPTSPSRCTTPPPRYFTAAVNATVAQPVAAAEIH